MSPEETGSRSTTLDKPLHLLTEEDISQLTREDCRRFLKEKGMRRPSWNKSQAIQQVISLKKLLEAPSPDSDAGARRRLYIPRPDNPQRAPKTANGNVPSVPAEEPVPYRRRDPEKPPGDSSGRLVVTGNDSVPPRNVSATNGPIGQMTIFYCGKVNVYDDVPADKARALMELAASPLQLPLEVLYYGSAARRPFTSHLESTSVDVGPDLPTVILSTSQTANVTDNCRVHREESGIFHESNPAAEGPGSRKASVQRYLEKRKDRFKSKRKVSIPTSASLDIYLSHQMGNQTPNESSNRSDTCSPPQIRPPNTPTRCSSVENNIVNNPNLSAGLFVKDKHE
ncbi:hypothetical protein NMG60_11014028 [Bertholletia excelsa]